MTATGAPSIAALVNELAVLRLENAKLRTRVEAVERATAAVSGGPRADEPRMEAGAGLSRRALMRRGGVAALAGLAAAAAGGVLAAAPVNATDFQPVLAGQANSATHPTALAVTDTSGANGEYGFGVTDQTLGQFPEKAGIAGHANNTYDDGVLGYGENGTGVRGISDPDQGIGVHGSADGDNAVGVRGSADGIGGWGVSGSAALGAGVVGIGGDTKGVVILFPNVGVGGFSKSGIGVVGLGLTGGVFEGTRSQLSLVPGSHATHPARGDRGDLYVDKTGRLWYCRTGGKHSVWHQLA